MQIVNIQHRKAMIKYQGKSVGVVMRRCFIYNKEAVEKKTKRFLSRSFRSLSQEIYGCQTTTPYSRIKRTKLKSEDRTRR